MALAGSAILARASSKLSKEPDTRGAFNGR